MTRCPVDVRYIAPNHKIQPIQKYSPISTDHRRLKRRNLVSLTRRKSLLPAQLCGCGQGYPPQKISTALRAGVNRHCQPRGSSATRLLLRSTAPSDDRNPLRRGTNHAKTDIAAKIVRVVAVTVRGTGAATIVEPRAAAPRLILTISKSINDLRLAIIV